jgi:hypothetical protein
VLSAGLKLADSYRSRSSKALTIQSHAFPPRSAAGRLGRPDSRLTSLRTSLAESRKRARLSLQGAIGELINSRGRRITAPTARPEKNAR